MKITKNIKIILLIIIAISIVLCIISLVISKKNKTTYKYSSKYILVDGKNCYILNDGGSHKEQYYEIDLANNIVEKKEDYENKSLSVSIIEQKITSYKGKTLETKNINQNQSKEIKKLIEEYINKNEKPDYSKSYPNILKYSDKQVNVSENDMNKFLEIIK